MDFNFNTIAAPTKEAFAEAGPSHFAFNNDLTDISEDQSNDSTFLSPSNHIGNQSFVSNQVSFPDDTVATWTLEWDLANLRAVGLNHYSLNDLITQTKHGGL
jgi:beta-glucanase (GH16 family)